MEWTEQQRKIIEKAEFYKFNEIKAHVLIIPKPQFKNGLFVSNLKENSFFWFIENNSVTRMRLFLNEIHDIEDYNEKGVEDEKNS